MTVSSHLTPEPERRLWLILENMRRSVEWADVRIGALTLFAALELSFIKVWAPSDGLTCAALTALAAALPLGVFSFSPLQCPAKWLMALVDPPKGRQEALDSFVSIEDIVNYSHGELILKLDRYLGGGITATQYYEDLIGEIIMHARAAARKQRLLKALSMLVGAAQMLVVARLLLP